MAAYKKGDCKQSINVYKIKLYFTTSLVIRDMKITTLVGDHSIPNRPARQYLVAIPRFDKDVEGKACSFTIWLMSV